MLEVLGLEFMMEQQVDLAVEDLLVEVVVPIVLVELEQVDKDLTVDVEDMIITT